MSVVLTETYANGYERTLTVNSAVYANAENTAAVIFTDEAAAKAISQLDTPDLWQQLIASGLAISAYEEPQV